jgi:Protein of unknown function (DUF1616)
MNGRMADVAAPVAAVACAIVACAVSWIPLRTMAAAPLCLVLPGYALTRAIFAGSQPAGQPTRTMRMTLTVALSLITLILGSVALSLAPGGIQRDSWAALLIVVTAGASVVSALQRREASGPPVVLKLPRASLASTVMVLLAAVISVGALVASRIPWPARNAVGYTQLWMLPSSSRLSTVTIGLACDELNATDYRLVLRDGRQARIWRIALRPGETRRLTVVVQGNSTGYSGNGYATATLYRDQHAGEYRQVRLALSKL